MWMLEGMEFHTILKDNSKWFVNYVIINWVRMIGICGIALHVQGFKEKVLGIEYE